MPGAAPRAPPGAKAGGASPSAPSPTDQNNGDLLPFMTALQAQLPAQGAGTMSIAALLTYLQGAAPQVFAQLDRLVETARRVSGLDEAVARQWKEQGNKAYAEQQLEQAVQIYTQGLLCAESDEMVATLLNNRSTAFFELHNYAAACLDADRALRYKADYWKALQRRGRALEELGMRDLGRTDCEAAARENMAAANTPAAMQRVFGENTAQDALPPRLHAAAKIAVADCGPAGRGVVALGALDCGTVVEERPYAFAARTEALLSVCAYCLQPATCLYQGDEYRRNGCKSRGLFCSEACATRAWDYFGRRERREVFFLCCPNDALLAWRLLRMMDRFPDYVASPDVAEDGAAALRAQLGPAAASLRRRQEGSTHSRELDAGAGVGGAESVVAALGFYMKAFAADEAEAMRWAQRNVLDHGIDVSYVLQLTTPSHATTASAAETLAGATQSNTVVVPGRAMYAFLPHFNHACDPNCFVSFVGNPQSCSATVVVRAIRPIAANEELTIAYHGITRFHFHSLQHRLQTLRERDGFVCRCPACTAQVDEPVYAAEKEHYIKAADFYQKGRRLIREGKYRAAVTVLLQSYEMLMRYICPPPRPPQSMLPKTHNALALAYYHLNDTAKTVEHLQAELELDVAIHGTDNRPEMINNYARLAFLAATPEARAKFGEKAIELLTRFYAPSPSRELQISSLRHGLK